MTPSNDLNFTGNLERSRSTGALQFVGFQGLASFVLFVLLMLFGSVPLAVSALWAGLSIFLGNLVFLTVMHSGFFGPSVVSVLVGQLVKLVVVLALLGVAVWAYEPLMWAGFMLGLVVALLFVFIAPFILSRAEKKRDGAKIDALLDVLNNKK